MIIRCDLSFMCFSESETRCEYVMLDYNEFRGEEDDQERAL